MDGTTLRQIFNDIVPADAIEELAEKCEVVERKRKLELDTLVWSLVLTAGSEDSGRLADAMSKYVTEAEQGVARASFYSWFTDRFANLMEALLKRALSHVRSLEPHVPHLLGGVKDWYALDSETITLPDAMLERFPSTSERAGLKVHKFFSLGRNNMVDVRVTPAREHDSRQLKLDESWRGYGLVVDLAYVSIDLLRKALEHGVSLVVRLKDGWKPTLLGAVDDNGEFAEVEDPFVIEGLVGAPLEEFDGKSIDLDVRCGRAGGGVVVRLVGAPGEDKYHWCLTTMPRETHSPEHVCNLYRCRWEIELDMKRDKTGAGIDHTRARKYESTMALMFGGLLHTVLANHIVYKDLISRPKTQAPLHGIAVSLVLKTDAGALLFALAEDTHNRWSKVARAVRQRGADPNWRARPSTLDVLRGTTAPPGRPRRKRLQDCPRSAAPYRSVAA